VWLTGLDDGEWLGWFWWVQWLLFQSPTETTSTCAEIQNQLQRNQNLFVDNNSLTSTLKNDTKATNNNYSHDLQAIASQFEKQRQEIDVLLYGIHYFPYILIGFGSMGFLFGQILYIS
jgi:hypothetical protein